MGEHLTPLDASFLEIEQLDDASHMHIGWAMVFDPLPRGGAPTVARVRRHVGERLAAFPRFGQRLSSPRTGGLSWPTWEADDRFDVADHVRHMRLPAPGGDAELRDWLADFFSHRLDRARPLWEVALLDGLSGGRWALVSKVHHCLLDGASAAVLVDLLLDPVDGERAPEAPRAPAAPTRRGASGLLATGIDLLRHPGHVRELADRARAAAELVIRDELTGAPATSLNVPIGSTRAYAVVEVPLAELKGVRAALGGTVNDVVLAAATGALRAFLLHRGEALPARGLRAMVPVSIRATGEQMRLGNRVSSLFVELPVAEPDPRARHAAVRAAADALKAGGQAGGSEAFVELAGLAPPALHALAARLAFAPRLFNVTITNVPGPVRTLHAFGAPMRAVLPLVPVFAGHALGIAVTSYDGRVFFGLNADRAALTDLDVLAEALADALAELRELAALSASASASARARGSARAPRRSSRG